MASIDMVEHVPVVLTTLPGAGTGAYTLGKLTAVFFSYRYAGKAALIIICMAAIYAGLLICVGMQSTFFAAWLPFRLVAACAQAVTVTCD